MHPAWMRRRRRSRGRPWLRGSTPYLGGEGDAGGVRDALADDSARAQEAASRVAQVHRAAVASAQAVLAAVDLGHHRLGVGAQGDRVAVAAVGRQQLVAVLERRQRPDDGGLGAVGEMGVAPDHAGVLLERPLDALLEVPDAQHLGEHPDQPFVAQLGGAHPRSPLTRRRRGPAPASSHRHGRIPARSAGCEASRTGSRRPRGRGSPLGAARSRSPRCRTRPRRGARGG